MSLKFQTRMQHYMPVVLLCTKSHKQADIRNYKDSCMSRQTQTLLYIVTKAGWYIEPIDCHSEG